MKVKHPESLADYERLCKEKIKDGNNTNANASIAGVGKGNVFQSKLDQHLSSSASKSKPIKTQNQLDDMILNHIISDLLPLSKIEKEGFKELIGFLIGSLIIKSRRSMMELLNKKYQSTKENLIAELQKAEYVCTTADCWTAHKRSFLGMTAHWHSEDKDSKEIVRRSACLGVRRIYGSHTHDVIVKAISDVHVEFQISSKVNCTITNNGSNFLKAFKMFSSVTPQDKDNLSRRSDGDEYEEDEFNDEEDDEEDVVYIEIGEILMEFYGQNQLQMEYDEEHEPNISI